MTRLDGRVALVAGGDAWLGRVVALRLAQDGAAVAVVGPDDESGAATVEEILRGGGRGRFVRADLSRPVEVRDAVLSVIAALERLDCVVTCAAAPVMGGSVLETSDAAWDATLDACLGAPFYVIKCAAGAMLSLGRRGAIVNIAAAQALFGRPGETAYTTAMHALLGLTRVASADLAGRGIRVNAVCPGGVDAPSDPRLIAGVSGARAAPARALGHLGRLARPDEVAAAVSWLCSDEASYVTGAVITVDGGASATL